MVRKVNGSYLILSDYVPQGQPAVKVDLAVKFSFLSLGPRGMLRHVLGPIGFDPRGADPREIG